MPIILPLILIAFGGAFLLVLRDGRFLLVGLGMQWFGLIVAFMPANIVSGGGWLGSVAAEGVTAVVCLAVLFITLRNLNAVRISQLALMPGWRRRQLEQVEEAAANTPHSFSRGTLVGQSWYWLAALVMGVVGYWLSVALPLGLDEGHTLALYWIALPAAASLALRGVQSSVSMAAALISLLNTAALALQLFSPRDTGAVALWLMCLVRIVVAVLLSYGWLLLKAAFLSPDLDFTPLSNGRVGRWPTDYAIVLLDREPVTAGGETANNVIDAEAGRDA